MRKTASSPALPQPGQGKRGEEGYLGYLLRQAAGVYRHRLERAMADLAVTPPQFLILTMLGAYPGLSNADLARLTMLTPQTVSVIIANLEKAGLVARHKHAIHGRIQHVTLNDNGRTLLAKCRTRAHTIEKELVADLPEDEQRAIRRWLVRVATGAGTDAFADDPR